MALYTVVDPGLAASFDGTSPAPQADCPETFGNTDNLRLDVSALDVGEGNREGRRSRPSRGLVAGHEAIGTNPPKCPGAESGLPRTRNWRRRAAMSPPLPGSPGPVSVP
jgi:hypothetical protein